eukprot:scaffold8458_cov76-Cylindrotheca_fusiformis.AAC.5
MRERRVVNGTMEVDSPLFGASKVFDDFLESGEVIISRDLGELAESARFNEMTLSKKRETLLRPKVAPSSMTSKQVGSLHATSQIASNSTRSS